MGREKQTDAPWEGRRIVTLDQLSLGFDPTLCRRCGRDLVDGGCGWCAIPAPYQPQSDTSLRAARVAERSAGSQRARVFGWFEGRGPVVVHLPMSVGPAGVELAGPSTTTGGGTDEECQLALGMNPSTQRPRRVELVRMFKLEDSGRRRKTSSGRLATVWQIKAGATW